MAVKSEEEIRQIVQNMIANFRLLDDDYMTKFFEKQTECVELVLQIILDDPSIRVVDGMSQTQYLVKNLQGKDIRLDLHAIDAAACEYDMEIQRADKGAGARRARYNSSLMDANCLDAGEYGNNLTETYVIFITENDIYKMGKPIYEIERYVDGERLFNDGAHILYVNGAYEDEETLIGKLMHDFRCKKAEDMYIKLLADRAKSLKNFIREERDMCKAMEDAVRAIYGEEIDAAWAKAEEAEKAAEEAEKAAEKAKAAAEEIALKQQQIMQENLAREMLDDNEPIEKVVKYSKLTLEEVNKIIESINAESQE